MLPRTSIPLSKPWCVFPLLGGLAATFLLVCSFGVSTQAVEEDEPAEEERLGLREILPLDTPEDLTFEAFEALGPNWEDWSLEVSDVLLALYETQDEQNVAAQRDLLANLKRKIGVMDDALGDPAYSMIHTRLGTLRRKLSRRVTIAEAVLDTLEIDPTNFLKQKYQTAQESLRDAISAARTDLQQVNGGSDWVPYLRLNELHNLTHSQSLSDEEQATLKLVAKRFRDREASDEQKTFLRRKSLTAVRRAAGKLLTAHNNLTEEPDTLALRDALAELVAGLEAYEVNASLEGAGQAKDALLDLEELAPDGGQLLMSVLRPMYYNYNLHVVAGEGLLTQFASDSRNDAGPVNDCVLGARVTGNQQTQVYVKMDLVPSNSHAAMRMLLQGETHSRTMGTTSQATIYTNGFHRFWGEKPITFNGRTFQAREAHLHIAPNNQTTGARTKLSWLPLLGRMTERIAVNEAEKRRPASQKIASDKLKERLMPEFESNVQQELATLNNQLSEVRVKLETAGLYPAVTDVRSSDTHIRYSTRTGRDDELGADRAADYQCPTHGILVQIHESLLNNALNRLAWDGQTMDEDRIRQELESSLEEVLGRELKIGDKTPEAEKQPSPANSSEAPGRPGSYDEDEAGKEKDEEDKQEEKPAVYRFADIDAIRLRVEEGQLLLVLRAGIIQEEGEDIPLHKIVVPLSLRLEGEKIVVERGDEQDIQAIPLEGGGGLAQRIARAGVIKGRIIRAIKADREFDRTVDLKREGKSSIRLKVTTLDAQNGWISLILQ